MKPNLRSPYFFLSLVFVILLLVQLFIVRAQVKAAIFDKVDTSKLHLNAMFVLSYIITGLAAWSYCQATKHKFSPIKQVFIFLASPTLLAPVISILYAFIVLMPIYSQANYL